MNYWDVWEGEIMSFEIISVQKEQTELQDVTYLYREEEDICVNGQLNYMTNAIIYHLKTNGSTSSWDVFKTAFASGVGL